MTIQIPEDREIFAMTSAGLRIRVLGYEHEAGSSTYRIVGVFAPEPEGEVIENHCPECGEFESECSCDPET